MFMHFELLTDDLRRLWIMSRDGSATVFHCSIALQYVECRGKESTHAPESESRDEAAASFVARWKRRCRCRRVGSAARNYGSCHGCSFVDGVFAPRGGCPNHEPRKLQPPPSPPHLETPAPYIPSALSQPTYQSGRRRLTSCSMCIVNARLLRFDLNRSRCRALSREMKIRSSGTFHPSQYELTAVGVHFLLPPVRCSFVLVNIFFSF